MYSFLLIDILGEMLGKAYFGLGTLGFSPSSAQARYHSNTQSNIKATTSTFLEFQLFTPVI
jgi:hypothetical protein